MLQIKNQNVIFSVWINCAGETQKLANQKQRTKPKADWLLPLRQWMDSLEIKNRLLAKIFARLIPARCPFERDIVLFGRKIVRIPALCKLNPLYDQFVGLRFRALCYLVEQCGEDIQSYC